MTELNERGFNLIAFSKWGTFDRDAIPEDVRQAANAGLYPLRNPTAAEGRVSREMARRRRAKVTARILGGQPARA